MDKKGYIYYELLMCLILLTTIVYFLLVPMNTLMMDIENQKLTYKMKQILILNVVLIEEGESLTNSDTYQFKTESNHLCIEWWDLNAQSRTYCEKIWI